MLLPRASGHLPEALLRGSHFPRAIFCDFWRSPLSPANADYAKTQVRAFDSAFWSIGVAYRTLCCRPPPFPNRACAPHHPPSSQIAAWSSTITILVTGSTGTIGSQVVQGLAGQSARVRALVRGDASKIKVPAGVEPVQGDLTDVASMRTALKGVDTLFLLNAVAADETTQALGTLGLAREAGIQRIVYFSTFNSALFDDVPHFASKYLVERVIDAQAVPATVLRPGAFMQNDLMLRDALEAGIYPQPIGGVGVAMVDIRDIADAVVAELLRRERAPHPLPRTTIELVGPDTLTGADIAAIWASVLGKDVRYGGDDLATFESQAAGMMPGWMAHDIRLMLRAFHRFGMIPGKDSRATFEALIGHPLRSYRAFAQEVAANW